MKSTMTRPLPLELTTPIELVSSVETAFREAHEMSHTTYNPVTQVRENPEGLPQFLDGSFTSSGAECNTYSIGGLVNIDADVVADDNL